MNAFSRHHRTQQGVSLIELMVALVIGLFLMLGAVYVFNQSRSSYRASEAVSRLQENGRLALDVLEADLRMANFWGMSNKGDYIINRAGPTLPTPAGFDGTQAGNLSLCGAGGSHWMITLEQYIGGTNNAYGLTCAASNYQANTDVVFIRRANETAPALLNQNRVYVQSSRIQGTLFVPTGACNNQPPTNAACIPADYQPPMSTSREMEAHIYYVSSQSTLRNDLPALRRKRLANVNGAVADALLDEEIVSGVEDMQVRFGVDTNGDTNVDQYVNTNGVPANATVISATIWLRIRAEDPDFGFVDGTSYQYADMAAAFTPNDRFRRIVVSKTIHLRNTRV